MTNVKTGITLFSLGTPYLKGELDLEGVQNRWNFRFLINWNTFCNIVIAGRKRDRDLCNLNV